MRTRLALAAIGLASLLAGAAHAATPPPNDADLVFAGNIPERTYYFADAHLNRAGDSVEFWAFGAERTNMVVEGKTIAGAWMLTRIDCKAKTFSSIELVALLPDLSVAFRAPMDPKVPQIVADSSMDRVRLFICEGQTPTADDRLPDISAAIKANKPK